MTVDDFDADKSKGKANTVLSYGTTDADGTFTIDTPLPRGDVYTAIVGAKGYQRIAEDDALEITAGRPGQYSSWIRSSWIGSNVAR